MARRKQHFLGLDFSQNQIIVHLLDPKMISVASHTMTWEVAEESTGVKTVDPYSIIFTLRSAIHHLFTQENVHPKGILGLLLLSDGDYAFAWNKVSGAPLCEGVLFDAAHYQRDGLQLTKNGAAQIYYERVQGSSHVCPALIYSKILKKRFKTSCPDKELAVGPLASWVVFNLSGRSSFVIDYTHAHAFGLLDTHTQTWQVELLAEFDLTAKALPVIHPSVGIMAATQGFLPVSDGVPIVAMAHSHSAAHIGHVSSHWSAWTMHFDSGHVCFGVGGESLASNSPKVVLPSHEFKQANAYRYALPCWPTLFGALEYPAATDSIFYPFNPVQFHVTPKGETSISNLKPSTTSQDISRAYLQTTGFYIKHFVEVLDQDLGVGVKEIVLDDSGEYGAFLSQLISDLTQLPVMIPSPNCARLYGLMSLVLQQDTFKSLLTSKTFNVHKQCVPQIDPISVFATYQEWHRKVFKVTV